MRLTVAWEERLPANTLSFDTLVVPLKPTERDKPEPTPLLVTLDNRVMRFWLWHGSRFELLREHPHQLQRDLFALSKSHTNKPILYTDGSGWEWNEKSLTPIIPTRQVPIGRLRDEEGIDRIVCFDGETYRPFYYILEKPLLEDEFFIEPEDIYTSKSFQSLVMSIPRLAESFRTFYTNGYRFLCRYQASEKDSLRVYGIAPNRIAHLELRENRRLYASWRADLRNIGSLRREMPLVVRIGDPKNEGRTYILVMRATNSQVKLTAHVSV